MTPEGSPTISIIIVSWNTAKLLKRCLDSIYAAVPPISFEVIVVDNASADMSVNMAEADFPEVMVVRNEENLGFAAGVNLGLARARGEFMMLLNPDTELRPGAAALMLDFMKSDPDVGLVGPRLVLPNGELLKSGRKFPSFLREALETTRLYRLIRGHHDNRMLWGREDFDSNVEVDEVSGACMLVRRAAFDSVGPLDERFFVYYEDVDWCLRMKKAGWKVCYVGEAEVVHSWAQGALKLGVLESKGLLYRSQYLYFLKHHGLVQALTLRALSRLLLLALRVKYAVRPPRIENRGNCA